MKTILVYGAGDNGRIVRNLVVQCGYNFGGYISDISEGPDIIGPFEKIRKEYSPQNYEIAMGIGFVDLKNRRKIYNNIKEANFTVSTLLHPASYKCPTAKIGEGTIVLPHAVIDFNTVIEEIVFIWPNVVVNHDTIIRSNTFLSPGCIINGFCEIGENCFIGAGAVIVDHISVPSNTFVKAGKVYKRDSFKDFTVIKKLI
jgi:sugar O-acyltransferase (sialic acid O-acetyltransferase NeuD family)